MLICIRKAMHSIVIIILTSGIFDSLNAPKVPIKFQLNKLVNSSLIGKFSNKRNLIEDRFVNDVNVASGFPNRSGTNEDQENVMEILKCLGYNPTGPSVVPTGPNGTTFVIGKGNISHTENSAHVPETYESKPDTNNYLVIDESTTLEVLCKRCHISIENCTCSKQTMLCSFLSEANLNQTPFTPTLKCKESENMVNAAVKVAAALVGIIGNMLVLIVTYKNYSNSSRCHRLIGALAGVDFVFSVAQFMASFPKFWTCEWIYGLVMCKILESCGSLSVVFALGIILIIALERHAGIVHPLSGGLSSKNLKLLVASKFCIWYGNQCTKFTQLRSQ